MAKRRTLQDRVCEPVAPESPSARKPSLAHPAQPQPTLADELRALADQLTGTRSGPRADLLTRAAAALTEKDEALRRIAEHESRSDRRHRGMVDASELTDLQRIARTALRAGGGS